MFTVNKLKYWVLPKKDRCGEIYVAGNSKPSFGLHRYICEILSEFGVSQQFFIKVLDNKFHRNPLSQNRADTCGHRAEGRTDMTKLVGASRRSFTNRAGDMRWINTLNAELNPICHLLALVGAHHILHVSRVRV